MKRLFLISSLVLAFCANIFAQVTGNAYLEGATDHSGIKVKFEAQSPTAQTDSTYTLLNGSYSINLKGGVYKVFFSKDELKSGYENSSNVLILTNQSLKDFILPNLIEVSSQAKGRWLKKYRYRVVGDVTVNDGDSLIIEPGTVVEFNSFFELNVQKNGKIIAVGTLQDSIIFTSANKNPTKGDWNQILILGKGIFQYCCIEYPNTGISGFDISIKNCEIKDFLYIGIDGGWLTIIEENSIHDFGSLNNGLGTGIYVSAAKNPIMCNRVFNGQGREINGISIYSGEVSNNLIYNINSELDGNGIMTNYNDGNGIMNYYNAEIKENIITNCYNGIKFWNSSLQTTIKNNILFKNKNNGVSVDNNFSNILSNNIFYGNKISVKTNKLTSAPADAISNNLFDGRDIFANQLGIVGFGTIVSKNNNGDDIDTYYNLFQDPLFVNDSTPILLPNSPAKKAGLNGEDIGFDITGTCLEKYFITRRNVADTLSISGRVHQGISLLGAGSVMAINKTTNTSYYGAVNANGTFKIDSIPAGNYILKAIPTSPLSNSYANTYYPNKTEESQAVTLALAGIIIDVDIYLALINGIEDGTINDWSVSPNPFTDQLVISSTSQISILDAMGNVVYTGTPTDKLDTSNWKAGFYILKNKTKAQKLIKY